MSAIDAIHAAEAALEAALAAAKAEVEPAVPAATPSPEPAPVVAASGTTSLLLGHIGQPPVKGHDY